MNTKEIILKVAEKLFITRGIDRTSIRDIAQNANINIAALNYHYKTKENLLDIIFERIISNYSPRLPNILDEDLPLDEKLYKYIDTYVNLLLENDQLPFFIISVLNRNPKKVMNLKIFKSLYSPDVFSKQIQDEMAKGRIKKIDPQHFFINMLSLIAFPFAIKYVIMEENNWGEDEFKTYILERKKIIYDLLILDLNLKN